MDIKRQNEAQLLKAIKFHQEKARKALESYRYADAARHTEIVRTLNANRRRMT